jgi:hypothetical protein
LEDLDSVSAFWFPARGMLSLPGHSLSPFIQEEFTMNGFKKSVIALGMVAGLFLASSINSNSLLADTPISRAARPVDPYPQWGNANGAWVVWWGNGQRSNWNYFKAYGSRDRAQTVAEALRGQGYVARVSPR